MGAKKPRIEPIVSEEDRATYLAAKYRAKLDKRKAAKQTKKTLKAAEVKDFEMALAEPAKV